MVHSSSIDGANNGSDIPMMIPHLPMPSLSRSRRVQQRQWFPSRTNVDLANQSITALNQLANSYPSQRDHQHRHRPLTSSTYAPSYAKQLPPSVAHRLQQRVYTAAARYSRSINNGTITNNGGTKSGDRNISDSSSSLLSSSADLSFSNIDRLSSHISAMNHYTSPPPAKLIIAANVSLPQVAGTAKLLDIVPAAIAATYADPSSLHRPIHEVKPARRAFLCAPDQYRLLLKRMHHGGMLSYTTTPMCVNGLFGVAKDGDSIRLIIDCRPVNALLVPSPHVALPTPDLITKFHVPLDQPLFAAKVDLSDYYHRIKMPSAWHRYFALPPVQAGDIGSDIGYSSDTIVYPCITTLPMGFSHAVYLAQAAHEHLIDTRVPLLSSRDRVRPPSSSSSSLLDSGQPSSADYLIDRTRHSVYIDDLNIYGIDRDAMSAAQQQYCTVMTAAGLPPKPSKVVAPTSSGLECLGVMVNGDTGEVGVSVTKLHKLRSDTLSLLRQGTATGDDIARIVGRWTWCFLVRRPSLAIFSAVYRFAMITRHRRHVLWPSVKRELHTAAMLAPLLYASIKVPFMPRIIASDASEVAQGVVAATIDHSTCVAISSAISRPGCDMSPLLSSTITSSNWRTIVSSPWQQPEHINSLEVRAALTSIRWSLSLPSSVQHRSTALGSSPERGHPISGWHGQRLLLCCDSSAALGSINKGRSSAHSLLRPLRTIAALLLASGVQLSIVWVPSAANPADAASRLFRIKTTKGGSERSEPVNLIISA